MIGRQFMYIYIPILHSVPDMKSYFMKYVSDIRGLYKYLDNPVPDMEGCI